MNSETEWIKQKMSGLFERIIETRSDYGEHEIKREPLHQLNTTGEPVEKTQWPKRDFRNIFIPREEYMRVCQNGGDFSLLYDCGSSTNTNWFLYNSPKRNRLFMIWVHKKVPSLLNLVEDNGDGEKMEPLGVIQSTTEPLYAFCFRKYRQCLNAVLDNTGNTIVGGFRDDVGRIIQV